MILRWLGLRTKNRSHTKSEGSGALMPEGNWGGSYIQASMPDQGSPLELILELGIVGISVVDHKPRELAYLYMEKFFISYSTGYDGGTTSRFSYLLVIQLLCESGVLSEGLHCDNISFTCSKIPI